MNVAINEQFGMQETQQQADEETGASSGFQARS